MLYRALTNDGVFTFEAVDMESAFAEARAPVGQGVGLSVTETTPRDAPLYHVRCLDDTGSAYVLASTRKFTYHAAREYADTICLSRRPILAVTEGP